VSNGDAEALYQLGEPYDRSDVVEINFCSYAHDKYQVADRVVFLGTKRRE
jgi:hypothetical protein